MQMSANTSQKMRVVVSADPAIETFIIDSDRQLTARGAGDFTTDLSPGLYKFKFRMGLTNKIISQSIQTGATPVTIQAPQLSFSSPTLFSDTSKTHEYQMDSAQRLSRHLHESLGKGSQLFLFVRTWTAPDARGLLQGKNPATGLTLHDLQGNLLVDFETAGERELRANFPFDPWAACNVNIAPGSYRLRLQTSTWGALEQIVVASPDWQTQMFLLQTACGDKAQPSSVHADLTNASVLLAPLGQGFDSTNSEFRLAEIARIALADRRSTLARSLLDRLLKGQFKNPMLGIYAANALLPASESDQLLLGKTLDSLRNLLGAHPDVEALALSLSDRVATVLETYDSPPMLASSWSAIVKRSIQKPDLISDSSLSSRIASHLWGDSIWLIWLADELEETALFENPAPVGEEIAQLSQITERLEVDESGYPKAMVQGDLGLNDIEEVLLSYILRATRTSARKKSLKGSDEALRSSILEMNGLSEQDALAQALGVPPTTVRATVRSLLKKLSATAANPFESRTSS